MKRIYCWTKRKQREQQKNMYVICKNKDSEQMSYLTLAELN